MAVSTSPSYVASGPPAPGAWRRVLAAGGVRVQLAILLLHAALLVTGRRPLPEGRFDTALYLLFLLVGIGLCLSTARREVDAAGRRFWRLCAAALGAWLLAEVVLLRWGFVSLGAALAVDLGYLAFYLALLLAFEVRRAPPRREEPRSDALDSAAVVLFCAFLLVELVLLPLWLHRPSYDSWVPSQSLYVVLDAVLVVRIAYLVGWMPDRRWQRVAQLLLASATLWLATDAVDAAQLAGWLSLPSGTPLDLLWYLPFPLLAVAAALPLDARPVRRERLRLRRGGVALYALLLPVLHLVHDLVAETPPALGRGLDVVTLVGVAVLGALALEQRRRLTCEYERIAAQQRETTRLLRQANERLEQGVATRTAELRTANTALEREVTERRIKEEALVALEKAVETTQVGVTIVDADQRIVYVNPAEARMHGYERDELIGQPVQLLAPPSHRRPLNPLHNIKMQSWHRESVNMRRDGSVFPVLLRSDLVRDAGGRPVRIVTTCEDISEQKASEAELRQSRERLRNLTSRLLAAREEERTRISRQVHDELGQTLTALKLDIAWLASKIADREPALGRQASSVSALIDQTIAAVQDISADLRPVVLDEFGVAAAIEWQLGHYAERTGLQCHFEADRGLTVGDRELATTLFRVFQELLTNVVRHARARRVEASLGRRDGWIELRVADDGVGISEEAIRDARSLGLIGIRERVQRLDGELTLQGAPNAGTVALVRFPETPRPPPPLAQTGLPDPSELID